MVCLDTDFLIGLDRRQQQAISKINGIIQKDELVFTTIVNVAEYYAGAFKSGDKNAIEMAKQYIKDFSVLLLDEQSALVWSKLYNEMKASSIADRDLFIASIAIANKQTLMTRNLKHVERVPDLKVESW